MLFFKWRRLFEFAHDKEIKNVNFKCFLVCKSIYQNDMDSVLLRLDLILIFNFMCFASYFWTLKFKKDAKFFLICLRLTHVFNLWIIYFFIYLKKKQLDNIKTKSQVQHIKIKTNMLNTTTKKFSFFRFKVYRISRILSHHSASSSMFQSCFDSSSLDAVLLLDELLFSVDFKSPRRFFVLLK